MTRLKVKYLKWDSGLLRVSSGLIDAASCKNLPRDKILKGSIKKLCAKIKDIKFITIKLPSNYTGTVNSLIKNGARLMDTELSFRYSGWNAVRNLKPFTAGLKLKFCKKCDSSAFISLAREMRMSRFFLDANIPKDKALSLWKTSIENHCAGFADQLLVAYMRGKPCGIVAIKVKNRKEMFLHIVGVLRKFQRKGIAVAMLRSIAERHAKRYSIYVETQSANINAQSAYRQAGFEYHNLKYVLHYWC